MQLSRPGAESASSDLRFPKMTGLCRILVCFISNLHVEFVFSTGLMLTTTGNSQNDEKRRILMNTIKNVPFVTTQSFACAADLQRC